MGEILIMWMPAGKLTGMLIWDAWFTSYDAAFNHWKEKRLNPGMKDPEGVFRKEMQRAEKISSSQELVKRCRKDYKIQLNPRLLGRAIMNRDPKWDALQA